MKCQFFARSATSSLVVAALIFASLPEMMEARVLSPSALVHPHAHVVLAKGAGGIKKPFNDAANGLKKPSRNWQTKPKYPLWRKIDPPRPPATGSRPHSTLKHHFNYNGQRPMRFDFNRSAK